MSTVAAASCHGEAQTTGQSIAVTLPKNVPEGCIVPLVSQTEAV